MSNTRTTWYTGRTAPKARRPKHAVLDGFETLCGIDTQRADRYRHVAGLAHVSCNKCLAGLRRRRLLHRRGLPSK